MSSNRVGEGKEKEVIELTPLQLDEKWEQIATESRSGIPNFLLISWRSVESFSVAMTIAGGIIVAFPIIATTVGVIGVGALLIAPAVLVGALLGYGRYRKLQKKRRQEEAETAVLTDKLAKLKPDDLHATQVHIQEALELLGIVGGHEPALKGPPYQELALMTLQAIEGLRAVTTDKTYEKANYEMLRDQYLENDALVPKPLQQVAEPVKKQSWFSAIGNGIRRASSVVGRALTKGAGLLEPFIGGFAFGLTLGGAGLGIALMALGAGASLTGVGAIGGVPVLAVGGIIVGGSIVIGLAVAAVDRRIHARQEKREKERNKANETLDVAISSQKSLAVRVKAEVALKRNDDEIGELKGKIRNEAVLQARENAVDEREQAVMEQEEKLKAREAALELKKQEILAREAALELKAEEKEQVGLQDKAEPKTSDAVRVSVSSSALFSHPEREEEEVEKDKDKPVLGNGHGQT